jgi:energy-converting hydrogenase A subunit M
MSTKDEKLELMKLRILKSYRWQVDVVKPLSKELGMDTTELEEIIMNKMDMISMEGLHPRFKSAYPQYLKTKLYFNLKLNLIIDVMQLIPKEKIESLLDKKIEEILNGKKYETAYTETKEEIKLLLK